MAEELAKWQGAIANSERKFNEIVLASGTPVVYHVESMFALQAITSNDYLMQIANSRPESLRDAIINIASVGLSLNPVTQYAYLVPRDGKACLDISYKGLIKLATDTGSMMWVRAEIVYEKDKFVHLGPAEKPEHKSNPFRDRGDMIGVYCIAKTNDGDHLVDVMSMAEVHKVRDKSQSWVKQKKGPWKDWPGEMWKKTIIKRASKLWPRTKVERLANAVDVLNDDYRQDDDAIEESKLEAMIGDVDNLADPNAGLKEADLNAWVNKNMPDINLLPQEDQGRLDRYVRQIREIMRERLVPAKTTKILCPNMGEIDSGDCPQCPQVKTCTTYNKEQ